MNIDKRPDVVYHYSSIDTLHKIFTGKKIWATSISYLNDHSEQSFFLDQLRMRLPGFLCMYPQTEASIFSKFESEIQQAPPFSDLPFVASFSQEGDSLPQWRAYCSHGSGVAIGFRADALEATSVCNGTHKLKMGDNIIDLAPRVSFKKIRYLKGNSIDELDEILNQSVCNARKSYTEIEEGLEEHESPPTLEDLLWFELQAQAGLTKHISFIDEKEYRLSASSFWNVGPALRYRPSRSTLIPYVELDITYPATFLEEKSSLHNHLYGLKPHFIERVVVGPSTSSLLTVEAVKSMFSSAGFALEIDVSAIPFRNWV